jgi:hypothetical protein
MKMTSISFVIIEVSSMTQYIDMRFQSPSNLSLGLVGSSRDHGSIADWGGTHDLDFGPGPGFLAATSKRHCLLSLAQRWHSSGRCSEVAHFALARIHGMHALRVRVANLSSDMAGTMQRLGRQQIVRPLPTGFEVSHFLRSGNATW